MPSLGVIPSILTLQKLEVLSYQWKPHDRIFIRLDKTSEYDGQTADGQTDRQNMV